MTVLTKASLTSFPKRLNKSRCAIPNPIDMPPLEKDRASEKLIVAVGRLTGQKGFDLLLSAFGKVAIKHPEWRLLIWGEGPDRAALERHCHDLELTDRVDMPGLTETPGAWVNKGDIFVLSSRFEGFGNVVAEAMLAGFPVLSTDCPTGPAEIIDDGFDGMLVPNEDVEALAEGLDQLISDAKLRQRIVAQAAVSAQRFLPEQVMVQWNRLIDEVLRGRPLDPERVSSPNQPLEQI